MADTLKPDSDRSYALTHTKGEWFGPIPHKGTLKPEWLPDSAIVMVAFNPRQYQTAMTWEFAEKRKAPAKERDWEAVTAFCVEVPSRRPEPAANCPASPDHADVLETIQNAADNWQAKGYVTALAEVRDMANVGRALMDALPEGYHYNDCPSEIVSDLQNQIADMQLFPAADAVEEMAKVICAADAGVPIGYFPDGSPMRAGGVWEEYDGQQHDHWRDIARAAIAAKPGQGWRPEIPEDLASLLRELGRAEWGQTHAHDAEGHGKHVAESVRMTTEHFGQDGPQHMHGLYLEGTETVICHTGTSPNSPQVARVLTGAWNYLLDNLPPAPAKEG